MFEDAVAVVIFAVSIIVCLLFLYFLPDVFAFLGRGWLF